MEHVAFEVPNGARTDYPGVGWTFWPEPCGQRLDGPARSVVAETQEGVEVTDGGQRGQEGLWEKGVGRALCWGGRGRRKEEAVVPGQVQSASEKTLGDPHTWH